MAAASTASPYDVVIVGSGFSGTATLVNLVRDAKRPLRIAMIERNPEFLATGLAYNSGVIDPEHMLNVQPSRMSIFPDIPNHFCDWLGKADKTHWLPEYQHLNSESYSVPRPVFGMYLQDQLKQIIDAGKVDIIPTEALDITPGGSAARIDLAGKPSITARQTVIATGNVLVKKVPFTAPVEEDEHYIADRWSKIAKARVLAIPPQGDILVLGTGAAMFDTLCNLNSQGHRGNIVAVSRNGFINGFYPDNYRPEKAPIPAPQFTDAELQNVDQFVAKLASEYRKAEAQLPDDGRTKSEEIMSAWELAIPALVARMPEANVKTLLDRYGSLLATMRLGLLPETVKHYRDIAARGQIEITAAGIIGMQSQPDGIDVTYQAKGQSPVTHRFASVINCMGQELDYAKIAEKDTLWKNLITKHQLTTPHAMGYGITVGENGELCGLNGQTTPNVIAVGPMRGADTTLRKGKLGLLAQSVETLRFQAQDAAHYLLQRLEEHSFARDVSTSRLTQHSRA